MSCHGPRKEQPPIAVQDEIRGVECKIEVVGKETEKVAKKIDDVEAAIAGGSGYLGMTNPEALLEQLRREKEQLGEQLLLKEKRLSEIEQLRANNAPGRYANVPLCVKIQDYRSFRVGKACIARNKSRPFETIQE